MNNAKRSTRIFLVGITLVFCGLAASICTSAQQAKNEWQRVYTGEESIIEIKSSAVTFQPGRILRAEFRTVFSKPENLRAGDSAVKYKTSLETIDFRMNDRRYRFFEIALLDAAGKLLQKKTADASVDWRVLKAGGINERLFNAAFMLTPLGSWRVVDFRFADRNPKSFTVMEELDPLIGIRVNLHFDFAEVGSSVAALHCMKTRTARRHSRSWTSIGKRLGSMPPQPEPLT